MKLILTIFKWAAAILCCFLVLVTVVMAVRYASTLYENNPDSYITIQDDNMRHEFLNTAKDEASSFIYAPDKEARYKRNKPSYSVDIRPNSPVGYYYMVSTLIFVSLGALILRMFWQIFGQISLDAPFNSRVVRLLYTAAYLYIISEVLGFIHYFVLGKLLNNALQQNALHQVTEKGDNLIIGLIILIIAVVYKRGLEIYEEHSLTV